MFNVIPEILYKLLSLLLPAILFFSGSSYAALDYSGKVSEVLEGADYTGLYEVYGDYFPIGAAVYSFELDDQRLVDFIKKNFNSITPEWELKPQEGLLGEFEEKLFRATVERITIHAADDVRIKFRGDGWEAKAGAR